MKMKSKKSFVLKPVHLGVAVVLAGAPIQVMAATASQAKVAVQTYSLAAGPLAEMLQSIARQGGRAISFDPALVSGYQGSAVSGSMTVEQAIATSLKGTDLALDVTANGTLTITRPNIPTAPTAAGVDAQLPEIAVTGATVNEDQLYYNPTQTSAVGRTEMALKEVPQSVQVVSGRVLQDRQVNSLAEALKNTAGVSVSETNRGIPSFKIRGFAVLRTSTNGVPNASINDVAMEGIERVEVIKGPDSITGGSGSPGGTINLVRKEPVTEDLRKVTLEVAEYGELKEAVDLGGALNSDKSLSYRLNLMNMKSHASAPDFDGGRRVYVAPALRWQSDATKLTFGAEYDNSRSAAPRAGAAYNGVLLDLPSARIFQKNNAFLNETKTAYYELNQSLIEDWSFNSKATYTQADNNARIFQAQAITSAGRVAFGGPASFDTTTDSWGLQNDIRGKFKTGLVTHKVLVGVDYQHITTEQYELSIPGLSRPYPQVSLYDPDSFDLLPKIPEPNYRSSSGRTQQRGLILQGQLDVGDRLHLLLATKRADWISDSAVYLTDGSRYAESSYEARKWVPNYGISYDLTDEMTVYANVLKGFTGSATVDRRTGAALPPVESKSKEVGAKFSLLGDALTLTTAYFELQQTNVAVFDVAGNAIGTQSRESKGYDISLAGEILPGWNLTSTFTHIKFKEDAGSVVFIGEPKNTFSLWNTYEFQNGFWKGFGVGAGVEAFSSNTGGYKTQYYEIPGGAITDASVFYHGADYSVTLGVKNIFDRTAYLNSTSNSFIPLREERNARLTFTYNF
ncbi:hypothetical protein RSA46_21050 [Pseudomonas oryzihabitans]|nr:hypothetical protein RSA46_21050 [Pseudomonas psychrotolerans]